MRILHIGCGFRPWRRGGLIAYAEDLMDEQVRRGDQVSYFFSGRQHPLGRRPRLWRWSRGEVRMIELVDGPLFDHGHQPDLEISEPITEGLLRGVLADVGPEVVHVHELAGLPLSVLGLIADLGIPAVFTLQDYFPLCPAFKLLDASGSRCRRTEVGADCMATLASENRPAGLLIDATVNYRLGCARPVRMLGAERCRGPILAVSATAGALEARRRLRGVSRPGPPAFQRRREAALRELGRVPVLIAMSRRVEEIYRELGVPAERLRTVHLTLAHIDALTPSPRSGRTPVVLGTLSSFESSAKGGEMLLTALEGLAADPQAPQFRVLVAGHVAPRYVARLQRLRQVEIVGEFWPEQLDQLLERIDVGLVTSIWEEAYGYVGIEYLAKGIPVVANALGGMLDYVREGETGWLNCASDAAGLQRVLRRVISLPEEVAQVSRRALILRSTLVKPISVHAAEMGRAYTEAGNVVRSG